MNGRFTIRNLQISLRYASPSIFRSVKCSLAGALPPEVVVVRNYTHPRRVHCSDTGHGDGIAPRWPPSQCTYCGPVMCAKGWRRGRYLNMQSTPRERGKETLALRSVGTTFFKALLGSDIAHPFTIFAHTRLCCIEFSVVLDICDVA
jgi:hypothetical protein